MQQSEAIEMILNLPEVELVPKGAQKRYTVCRKYFARLPGYDEIVLHVGADELGMLYATDRTRFRGLTGGCRGRWVVFLLAEADPEEFHELLLKAWRRTAPPRLALSF